MDATPPPDPRRAEQMFPVLDADAVARVAAFGVRRRWPAGAPLFRTGDSGIGLFVLHAGRVAITRHDGIGGSAPVIEHGPGSLIGETTSLSGRPVLVDATATEDVEATALDPAGLRALLVADATLGERITRALILRRVDLIASGAGGPILVAPAADPRRAVLANFLRRNGLPFRAIDPAADHEADALLASLHPAPADLPLAILADGRVLRAPDEAALARALGMTGRAAADRVYDVAIVGAGPAGLAASVYAASEGLSVIVLDQRSFGGQAGASARIENYFGFPTGITGQALTARGFVQAQKFGVEMAIPAAVDDLQCGGAGGEHVLRTDDGPVRARTVVVASGARYRRPPIPQLETFEGRGVWYWASPIEAQLCAGAEVALVGGGNSAGQAAVFLAGHAAKVRMMVRGEGLAATMSRYLIDRIAADPRIELMTHTEVVMLEGDDAGLRRIGWRDRRSGETGEGAIANLFLFVGADPASDWLERCGIARDRLGFVETDASFATDHPTRASSRSATCAAGRSSASAARSARAPRWWRRSTAISPAPARARRRAPTGASARRTPPDSSAARPR
jgi:thioredoxin reductase (NADPH)